MAPDARWIAVKIFNDRGVSSSTAIHRGFQWLLDPDGNPATTDTPDIVNNSWSLSSAGCSLEFQPDLRALRTAGILPVFAAGNAGPAAGTVLSPANNAEALAVGATDNADALYPSSGRGPSPCTGQTSPALVAPGTDIRTADLYGGYLTDTGNLGCCPACHRCARVAAERRPGTDPGPAIRGDDIHRRRSGNHRPGRRHRCRPARRPGHLQMARGHARFRCQRGARLRHHHRRRNRNLRRHSQPQQRIRRGHRAHRVRTAEPGERVLLAAHRHRRRRNRPGPPSPQPPR